MNDYNWFHFCGFLSNNLGHNGLINIILRSIVRRICCKHLYVSCCIWYKSGYIWHLSCHRFMHLIRVLAADEHRVKCTWPQYKIVIC